MESVSVFTDTYLPTVNGVTYTIATWREEWLDRGGRMPVVYPHAQAYTAKKDEHPVRSLPLPFYDEYHVGLPYVPEHVSDTDIVHVHGPFSIGIAGLRAARRHDLPIVASYHTPLSEYTGYLAPRPFTRLLRGISTWWERTFLDHADVVLAPSTSTRNYLQNQLKTNTNVQVLSNGIDTDMFHPVDPERFINDHNLPTDTPLIGYTGRHGYEKRLHELIDAAAGLDATLVLAGDGPAREDLEQRAADKDVDARFLGFLDREQLSAFYSALDVFAHPSRVETEGLVAREAIACGTPVVGANRLALQETIDDGATGYHFTAGDVRDLRETLQTALQHRDDLRETCLDRRELFGVVETVDRLEELYSSLTP